MVKATFNAHEKAANFALCILAISIALGVSAHLYHHWFSELFTHFQIQYAVGGFILLTFYAICKARAKSTLAFALCAISVFQIQQSYSTVNVVKDATDLKILVNNRRYNIEDHDNFTTYITQENPDIAIIQEATQTHSDASKTLSNAYPHQLHEPRVNAFGMVVLSKYPLKDAHAHAFDRILIDNIQVKFEIEYQGQDVSIYAIHPPPPLGSDAQKQRNMELEVTADDILNNENSNVIMVGDWNMSPFSPHFKSLIKTTGLKNEFSSTLIFPTWPSQFATPILQIPIDHILHKGHLTLTEKRRGEAFGSDHYPVIASFSIADKN